MTLDALNPVNWFPFYHAESKRRAVPAHIARLLAREPQCYHYLGEDCDKRGFDPWRMVVMLDLDLPTGQTVIHFDVANEKLVAPEYLVYMSETNLKINLKDIHAALKSTYDFCWSRFERKLITREDFDTSAEALRCYRAFLDEITEEYKR